MQIDPSLNSPGLNVSPQKTKQLTKGERDADFIFEINSNPKGFIIKLLTSSNHKMPERRRYWGAERGLPSTMKVINTIKSVVSKSVHGKKYWNEWVLSEVCLVWYASRSARSILIM